MPPRRAALGLRARSLLRRRRQALIAVSPGRLVFIIATGLVLAILGDANIYVSLPTHTAEAGIPLVYVGLMQSLNRITRIIINGPYGIMLERVPRRPVMIVSLLFAIFSNLCYIFPGFWPLFAGRILWGMCWAGIWLGGHAMLFDIVDEGQFGERTGQLQMGFWVGAGVSSFFSGVLTDWLGYREYFMVSAVVVFVGWLFWLVFLPETFGRRKMTARAGTVRDENPKIPEPAQPLPLPLPLPLPPPQMPPQMPPLPQTQRWGFLTMLLLAFINWFIFLGIAGSLWPIMINERTTAALRTLPLVGQLGVSSFTGIMTAFVILTVNALAAPWIGRLSDRFGRTWLMLAGALLLGAVTMFLSARGYGVGILLSIFFQGLVMSILGVLVTAQVGRIGPARQTGRRLGLLNIFGDIGGSAGPLLAFALLPLIELAGVLTLAGGILLLAFPLVAWMALQEGRAIPGRVAT